MQPSELIKQNIPYTLTTEQDELLGLLDTFITAKNTQRSAFLIKGYAGTGKTMIISELVQVVKNFGYKTALVAPTGRAAKVLATYSKKRAYTIHKKIYRQTDTNGGGLVFQRMPNTAENTIFIVDEASMISDKADFGKKSLLEDLISFVFSNIYANNKILFIGDNAQLPPVGETESPALQEDFLRASYGLDITFKQLTQVMRQEKESGILHNATQLRENIAQENYKLNFKTKGFKDFYKMTSDRLEDGLIYAYNKYGAKNTIVVCRSNKTANQYNQYIRKVIRGAEEEIELGDLLMIVKNNYSVLQNEDDSIGFLANGDFVEIVKAGNFEEKYGLRFVTLTLRLLDYPDSEPFEAKVMLDTLYTNTPSLPQEDYQKLLEAVKADYADITQVKKRNEALKADEYMNALQVKFAYALTCHKSQGGQWDAIFVEQGYLTDDNLNLEFLRWLYTGVTRATKEVFLVNFHERFFDNN